jgi:hypothetical protein
MPRTTSKKSVATLKSLTALKKYLSQIKDAATPRPLSAFTAFPKSTRFDGQDADEHIVLLLRQHPAVFIPRAIIVLGMLLLPFFILPLLSAVDVKIGGGDALFAAGVIILWVMVTMSVVFITFFLWYFNVSIVTNERIVDIDFTQLFDHRVSECQLEKIEDVTHSSLGMWAVIFDYGTVYIQTAAEQREFDIINVPRPRDVQDTINDLLELIQP